MYFYKNRLEHNFTRSHSYDTRRDIELCPINQRLNSTQGSINYEFSMVWNETPTEIKSENTLKSFIASLKKYYLVSNHPFDKFSLVSIFITFGSIGVFSVIPCGMTLNCNLVKGDKTRI